MFKSAEINFAHENIIESLDELARAYSTSTTTFLHALGLLFELAELDNDNPENRAQVSKRLCEIDSLLNAVRSWFLSDSECWSWFMNEQLVAFSHLTPTQIVSRYQSRGITLIREWAEERKLGNFQ
jgi:hypothetical protein